MTENKPFELTINERGQADIIDQVESKEKNAICIYNDLGVLPYSSAKAVCNKLNEQEETIQELKTEVLDLRAEVGRLNCKKEIEKPHWLKYESSKGYTKKVNQDIRFKGD